MRIHNIIKTVCLAGSLALLSACEGGRGRGGGGGGGGRGGGGGGGGGEGGGGGGENQLLGRDE